MELTEFIYNFKNPKVGEKSNNHDVVLLEKEIPPRAWIILSETWQNSFISDEIFWYWAVIWLSHNNAYEEHS